MLQALVTGANGFLGQYIAKQLIDRGDEVRALCRRPSSELDSIGADVWLADIREKSKVIASCAGVDVVYHVAGVAGIWGSWDHYHGINTRGTCHVIAGCREHRVSRLVYTSSPSVTFDGTGQIGVNESVPYPRKWLANYPHSKALAEQEVLRANGPGLLTCALRPHLIWGPRDRHLFPRLLARARQGGLRRVGDGRNLIDTVYVANAAQAHLMAGDALVPGSPVCGSAYFISQGEPVNCWEWINELLALADLPAVRKSISLRAAWHIGAILEFVHQMLRIETEPRMTRFLAVQLGKSHFFDISRARRDFGYQPTVSTSEGLVHLREEICQMRLRSQAQNSVQEF